MYPNYIQRKRSRSNQETVMYKFIYYKRYSISNPNIKDKIDLAKQKGQGNSILNNFNNNRNNNNISINKNISNNSTPQFEPTSAPDSLPSSLSSIESISGVLSSCVINNKNKNKH